MVRLYRTVTGPLRAIYGVAARADFIAALCALLGVVIFDTLPGLFIGIAVSVLLIVYRASRPHVAELGAIPGQPGRYVDLQRNPEAVPVVGVAILRVESELFFANAETVRDTIRTVARRSGTEAVVLDVEAVPTIDVTAASMLTALVDDLARDGVQLVVAREFGQVHDVLSLNEAGHAAIPVFSTVHAAVAALAERHDD